jgi:hypothetical protein
VKSFVPLVCLVLLAGCRQRLAEIEVMLPNAAGEIVPARGVVVMALPYDRDSILVSLENAAATPRPPTAELDSLFQLFRGPFEESTRLAVLAGRLRDTLRLAEADPARAAELPALRDSLARLDAAAAAAAARLATVRERVNPRIDELRQITRRWEAEAFRDYGDITASLTGNRLAAGIADTTSALGTTRLYLPPGSKAWWIHARSFNSGDPNSEWYWNVPLDRPRIVLDTSNARLRHRY